jgi:outer membrane protein TolC
MPTFRHFVAVGVGAAITLGVVPKAIALSLVEPGASKELSSLQQLRPNLAESGDQEPPLALTQQPFLASDHAGEEDAKMQGLADSTMQERGNSETQRRKDAKSSPVNLSVSTPASSVLQADPNKQVVNSIGKQVTGRRGDGETGSFNQERGSDAAPDAQMEIRAEAETVAEEFPASERSLSHKPVQENELNSVPASGVAVLSVAAVAPRTLEQGSKSPLPSLDGASIVQSPRPNREAPAPEYLNPSPNPLLFPTQSQEVQIRTIQPITLQQALELARRNNRNLEAAKLTLERNQAALQEALAAEFPTLGVTTTFSRSESTSQRLRNDTLDDNPLLSNNSVISETFNGALQANYDLYTSGLRPAQIRQAEQQVRFQQLEVERLDQQTRLDISSAYYNLQQADAQVEIFRAAVQAASQSLRDAQLLEQAGLGTQFDVLQAQVDLANANQDLTRAISQQRISRRQLVQLLSLSQTVDITAADPIEVAGQWSLSLEQSIVLAYKNRAELEQFLVQRDIGEQQRRIALAAVRPQASLSASYNILGILNDGLGPAGGLSLGATLRWNFFDGGAAKARAEQARRNSEIAETRFADQRDQVRFEVEQAFFNLNANAQNIQTATVAAQQAERSLQLARLRFQAGVGTQTDVINQQTALTRARVNRLTAILDYNRALANLQRATSNLPDSNLYKLP